MPSTYTSHLSLPYTTPSLPLRTLDLHLPTTNPPHLPSYTLIYIHGGAFRDPLITSQSLLPALPHLFFPSSSTKNQNQNQTHIAAIASVNYRLSPYPTHATQPSDPEDGSRNANWPDHVRDVRAALEWLSLLKSTSSSSSSSGKEDDDDNDDGEERAKYPKLPREYILIGHSVGATIAFALALGLDAYSKDDVTKASKSWKVRAVVGVEGIYDFTALRDAHVEYRAVYEEFTVAAFGKEEDGGWERGNMVRAVMEGRGMEEGTEVVVLGHSREDELVEWGQVGTMEEALKGKGWRVEVRGGCEGEGKMKGKEKEVVVMELKGGHDEVWEEGRELARCVALAVEKCVERDSAYSS